MKMREKMENERNKIKLCQSENRKYKTVRKSKIQNSSRQNRENGGEVINKIIYKNYPEYKGVNFLVEIHIIVPCKMAHHHDMSGQQGQ